ncbi:hypothetical protein [Epilithonimonas lactis]|uniref:Uncharacterized protein n=1 Tax=Epilithonimonas lactis TaxID=421072 RepID=A0A085BI52_9FLAO|nr:hypothetical protein [Epilithonimonas lactis]KFC22147.1 hypothetical protein IO89_09320 [Epilithonimonas lactis]SEQ55921.1 hypothetical protein SAMN04488097_2479 [Epilithonimonas lactis]
MKNYILIFSIILFNSCEKKVADNFPILSEFNQTKNQYRVDSTALENVSSEGGEIICYQNNSDKLVFDFFIYGETGKLNYTYFTDKTLKYQFVVKRNYEYDRPIIEKNVKIDSTINYINYKPNKILYDENSNEIKDIKKLNTTLSEIDSFFKNTLKNNVTINK